MLERGGGRIINGLSAGAFSAGGIYGISKYALHSLTANLASELGPQGINVNAIAPGLVAAESGYVSLAEDSPIRAAIAAGIPGKKSGPPEDLVGRSCCSVRCWRLDQRPDHQCRRRLGDAALIGDGDASRGTAMTATIDPIVGTEVFEPHGAEYLADPYAYLAGLRDEGPC